MQFFEECSQISALLGANNPIQARDLLIRLLDKHHKEQLPYTSLLNHLIRESGLFPYLDPSTSSWQDRYVYEAFKVDIGNEKPTTLHSEQSLVLKHLLEGANLAVSAPTSFGKSLIIDAFIAIRKPRNVLIVVPTIALTDETRRRLARKFSKDYKIITTADVALGEQNILIFPQERALQYCDRLTQLDLLVVDEFYKASDEFDDERSPALLKAMMKLSAIATQRYYLAPNISQLKDSPFTQGMTFLRLDFNTVFLEKHDLYKDIQRDAQRKNDVLINVLSSTTSKSLIYAGTYSNVESVSNLLIEKLPERDDELLRDFSRWLSEAYAANWTLASLVRRGVGIHTGQLHRSLSQIQVKLFEEPSGLQTMVSTSSIIEGVNTAAENVVVWSNRNGTLRLNDFTYRNIIGRGGRMFRHFVGKIYILEEPPAPLETALQLRFPDQMLADVDETQFKQELTREQIAKIILYKEQMTRALGGEAFERLTSDGVLISADPELITEIVLSISQHRNQWRGLAYLNSDSTEYWEWILMKVLKFVPGGWEWPYRKFIAFVKVLSTGNWRSSIPELLVALDGQDVTIDAFFKLERNATFKLAALLSDINAIQKEIMPEQHIDISPFVARLSRAFLPSCVYHLEEYGLPRMLSKKLHLAGLVNFEDEGLSLHDALTTLDGLRERVRGALEGLGRFESYVLDYFLEGIAQTQAPRDSVVVAST